MQWVGVGDMLWVTAKRKRIYQCFMRCEHNWKCVYNLFVYGVAIQESQNTKSNLYAMHWSSTFTGFSTKLVT